MTTGIVKTIGNTVLSTIQDNRQSVSAVKVDGKDAFRVKTNVGRVDNAGFERLSYIAIHTAALLNTGKAMTKVLGNALSLIDATRLFSSADYLFFDNQGALKDLKRAWGQGKNGQITEKFSKRIAHAANFAANASFTFVGAASTALLLDEWGVLSLASISEKIGSFTSMGGLGFIGSISLGSALQVGIAVGCVFTFAKTAANTYRKWDNLDGWQRTFAFLSMAGSAAEVAFRVICVTTGTAPVVLPVLGLISNGIGYLAVAKDAYKGEKNRQKFEDSELNKPKPVDQKNGWSKPFYVVKNTFDSIKGMDKVSKLALAVSSFTLPHMKVMIGTFKGYRALATGRNLADSISMWINGKKKWTLKRVANVALIAAHFFDMMKFVTKANIANLGYLSSKMVEFNLLGIAGRVSLNSLKLTSVTIFMVLDVINAARDLSGPKPKMTEEDYFWKLGLTAGKIGLITLTGGLILGSAVSASAGLAVAQIVVCSFDLADWIRKNPMRQKTEEYTVKND